jgi:hypothetical protein
MPTSGYLSQNLRRPLPTKDDGILRTVADAAGYIGAEQGPSARKLAASGAIAPRRGARSRSQSASRTGAVL